MSNQEIFEMLTDAECELFHMATDDPKNEDLKAAHAAARQALELFAKSTGWHNCQEGRKETAMKKQIYVVYANLHGCKPEFYMAYETKRAAEIGAACARNDGMDAFIRVEEE